MGSLFRVLLLLVLSAVVVIAAAPAHAAPRLSVSDASVAEGAPGGQRAALFRVTLSQKAKKKVKATYATSPGSAGTGDFAAASGKLKIKKGKKSASIPVQVIGDSIDEANETFTLTLSKPKRAKLADSTAAGAIIDDDPPPGPGPAPDSDGDGVSDSSDNCVATPNPAQGDTDDDGIGDACDSDPDPDPDDTDSDGVPDAADNCPGLANATQEDADTDGKGDVCDVCPAIPNPGSDPCPPTLSIVPAAEVDERNPPEAADATGLIVELSAASESDVSATFTVDGGTAEPADLDTTTGTVVVPAGETTAPLPLEAVGDYTAESDETATVTLSAPVNAVLGNSTGTLTLIDDDASPGELIVNEFLAQPLDGAGEWVEVVNVGSGPINLTGLQLFTQGTLRCTLSGSIGAGDFHVASPDPLVADSSCAGLVLPNACGGDNQISVSSPDAFLDGAPFCPSTSGRSASLDPDQRSSTSNDLASSFCLGVGTYGATSNQGTPGSANPQCP